VKDHGQPAPRGVQRIQLNEHTKRRRKMCATQEVWLSQNDGQIMS